MKFSTILLTSALFLPLSACGDPVELEEVTPPDTESAESTEVTYGVLEGVEMSNPSSFGAFAFGGQPTAADLEALKAKGVTRIVDLRTEAEDRGYDEAAVCEELGLTYVALPFSPRNLDEDVIAGILAELKQDADGEDLTTLVHCASGNRAHLMFSIHRVREEGVDIDAALADARAQGMVESLETVVRELLAD
ncbi:MAG: hypothetical protein ACI8QS_000544 [Planctomycetota bacterium]|jgi:uncharacterized protein (TIGR01244 family)